MKILGSRRNPPGGRARAGVHWLVACAATLGLFAGERTASADEPTDLESALSEPVVATASKAAEDERAAPATTTTITAEDLRRYGIHSLDEAINYLSLGMITQNPLHSVDIGARGVLLTADFGNHVLLLVNGHAMNEQWDGTAYFERGAGIPLELVDHIEVILGPGSVLYGANAMLGVINIVTKRARDYDGLHLIGEADLLTSWRAAVGLGREFTMLGKPAEVTAQIEYYRQDGPAFTFGPQNYGNDAVTGMPKRFSPDGRVAGVWGGVASHEYSTQIPTGYIRLAWGDWQLDARAESYQRATPYPNQFNTNYGDFDDPGTYELDRWLSADLKHRAAVSSIAQLRSRLYGDAYDYQQRINTSAAEDCLAGQANGCRRYLLGVSRWAGLEEQLSVDWLHDGALTTLFGVDGRLRFVTSKTDVTGADSGSTQTVADYTRTESLVAMYAQQTWRPAPWLALNVGGRLDDDQRFGTKLSPRAAVAIDPWRGGTLKLLYSEAFRSPTAYETSYTDRVTQVPAPDLKPETVRSVEASIQHRFGSHRILFGAFRSWWSDMALLEALTADQIAAAVAAGQLTGDATAVTQYQNVSSIDNYGYNLAFEGTSAGRALHYAANVTGAYARRNRPDGSTQPLTVAPQIFGNARISYDLPGELPVIGLAALVVGRRPADRALDGGFTPTPYAPMQVELRATLSGPVPGVSGLSYRAFADWASASTNPYVVGPVQSARPGQPSAELVPVDPFRVTMGLQYVLR
jgi:outer membrane receptor for ferrienterochelin and colicins